MTTYEAAPDMLAEIAPLALQLETRLLDGLTEDDRHRLDLLLRKIETRAEALA